LGAFIMALATRASSFMLESLSHSSLSPEQYETDAYTNVSFTGHELWTIQENGNICMYMHSIHVAS
jgi:hypothetical protein